MKFSHYLVLFLLLFAGCAPQPQTAPAPTIDPASTVGSLSRIYVPQAIQVQGIGIVAGLAGTGSSECPASIRADLEKFIWQQVPDKTGFNPRQFIDSKDTAVVEVFGTIPYLSDHTEGFDVTVRPLSSTQTTSLDGGYLYTVELKEMSRLTSVQQFSQYTKTIASASGPIYKNKLSEVPDNKPWYVMGGGCSTHDAIVKILLTQSDYLAANAIRNRINERFGPKICIPNSPAECTLSFPPRYQNEKDRFLRIINSLLLSDNEQNIDRYIASSIDRLVSEPNKINYEYALEGIGKPALDALTPLLDHSDEKVRFHAARCMMNIGSDKPVTYLRSIIMDTQSPYRVEAIRAIGLNSKSRDAKPLLMSALSVEDIEVRLAAYEMLIKIDSSIIYRKVVAGGNFIVDSVVCDGPKIIYVYQKDSPRIVLFGSPIQCRNNLFIQSDDGTITINAMPEDKYISVSRKHPGRPRILGPIKSGYELGILLQTLGEMPEISNSSGLRPGLAVPFAQIVPLVKKMCDSEALNAKFIAGPEFEAAALLQNPNLPADNTKQ